MPTIEEQIAELQRKLDALTTEVRQRRCARCGEPLTGHHVPSPHLCRKCSDQNW